MKTRKQTAQWVHVPGIERTEPATEITEKAVIEFRNGLAKFMASEGIKGTMAGTVAYRSVIDLDHLARMLNSRDATSTVTMSYVITPKHKKDLKRFMAETKKLRTAKWKKASRTR